MTYHYIPICVAPDKWMVVLRVDFHLESNVEQHHNQKLYVKICTFHNVSILII